MGDFHKSKRQEDKEITRLRFDNLIKESEQLSKKVYICTGGALLSLMTLAILVFLRPMMQVFKGPNLEWLVITTFITLLSIFMSILGIYFSRKSLYVIHEMRVMKSLKFLLDLNPSIGFATSGFTVAIFEMILSTFIFLYQARLFIQLAS